MHGKKQWSGSVGVKHPLIKSLNIQQSTKLADSDAIKTARVDLVGQYVGDADRSKVIATGHCEKTYIVTPLFLSWYT